VTKAKIDVIGSRLLDGKFVLNGPFSLSIGFAKFVIDKATLDTTGLSIDGRQRALVSHTVAAATTGSTRTPPDSTYTTRTDSIGATFATVRIDPTTGDVAAGTITFDGRLALESSPTMSALNVGAAAIGGTVRGGAPGALDAARTEVTSTNVFGFSLVDATGSFDPTGMTGNIRLELPTTPTIDARGMRITGLAAAKAAFGSTQYDGASVSFENDFAMRPAQGRVTAGRALLRLNDLPIAKLDASGWRIALAELVATVLPDTLFLPDQWSAYVVLRDAEKRLLVDVSETTDGPRIRTRAGTPVQIVVPALRGARASAPQATVAMDLTLARGSWRPLEGEIVAASTGFLADDFTTPDIPFAIDSLIFRATRGAAPEFAAHGRLDLWQGAQKPLRVALGIRSAGELHADLQQTFGAALGAPRWCSSTCSRCASPRAASCRFQWRHCLLSYHDAALARSSELARATLRISPAEAALVDFVPSAELTTLRLPGVDLRLGRVRAPTFRWDFARRRFDFELMFDVGLMIPALDSLELPVIDEVRLTPQGIAIPTFELSSMPVGSVATDPSAPAPAPTAIRVGGFSVTALAYRVREFRWNWFAAAPPPQFDFGVDLEFGVEDIPSGLEGQAARLALRALNVGVTGGRMTGTFERIDLPTPIRTPVADIRGAFGAFRVAEGQVPQVDIGLLADLRLPDLLACPDAASRMVSLQSARDTVFLAGNGTLRGTIRDVVPGCPMAIGPFALQFGASTARFGYDPAAQRRRHARRRATLSVPGDTPGETVTATGRVVLDIANARVDDASIAIDEPFFWAPAPDNPFLRLVVNSASLTQQSLAFGATGQLRTADGAGVDVAFEQVEFDLNSLALTDGRIRITADAAVGIEIPDAGELRFGVFPVTSPRGGTASARLVLPSGALIDTAGLHIAGTVTASLGFGGTDYAALAGEFANSPSRRTDAAIRRGVVSRDAGGRSSPTLASGQESAVLPVPATRAAERGRGVHPQRSATPRMLTRPCSAPRRCGCRVPASDDLPAGGGPVPTLTAELDLVLNSRTMRPVSGAIALEAAPGQSLLPLAGLPVALTQLAFGAESGVFRLRAGARAVLPGPLADVDLEFRDLEITAQGLTGTVELGAYAEVFDPQATPIAQARLLGDAARWRSPARGSRSAVRRPRCASADPVHALPGGAVAAPTHGRGRWQRGTPPERCTIPVGVAADAGRRQRSRPGRDRERHRVRDHAGARSASHAPLRARRAGTHRGSAGVRMPNVSSRRRRHTEFDLARALRCATGRRRDVMAGGRHQTPRGAVVLTLLGNTTRFIGCSAPTARSRCRGGSSGRSTCRTMRAWPCVITNGLERRRRPAPFTQQAPRNSRSASVQRSVTGGAQAREPEGLATAQTVSRRGGIPSAPPRRGDDIADAANTWSGGGRHLRAGEGREPAVGSVQGTPDGGVGSAPHGGLSMPAPTRSISIRSRLHAGDGRPDRDRLRRVVERRTRSNRRGGRDTHVPQRRLHLRGRGAARQAASTAASRSRRSRHGRPVRLERRGTSIYVPRESAGRERQIVRDSASLPSADSSRSAAASTSPTFGGGVDQ
jgi:hypothetical protein